MYMYNKYSEYIWIELIDIVSNWLYHLLMYNILVYLGSRIHIYRNIYCSTTPIYLVLNWTSDIARLILYKYMTIILMQFMLPHTRGSSSGHSRLMGNIYYKDCYLESMPEIYRLWQDLAQHTGVQIYRYMAMWYLIFHRILKVI